METVLPKKYFSKFKKPLIQIPDLAKDQVHSFEWLIEKGIKEQKRLLKRRDMKRLLRN